MSRRCSQDQSLPFSFQGVGKQAGIPQPVAEKKVFTIFIR
ncbi:hypothetical protein SAMN05720762_104197 [Fibrobacter sp. UWH4]|nr:hypothetical protein SAMN05720762_104197 [Fibrobacter sp. UWH4]